mgnify:CR=1 FL=1
MVSAREQTPRYRRVVDGLVLPVAIDLGIRVECAAAELPDLVAGLGPEWAGLSVTMPGAFNRTSTGIFTVVIHNVPGFDPDLHLAREHRVGRREHRAQQQGDRRGQPQQPPSGQRDQGDPQRDTEHQQPPGRPPAAPGFDIRLNRCRLPWLP